MAGSNVAFDAAVFRENIKQTMRMGLPGVVENQATFHWRADKTFAVQAPDNSPYNWSSIPITNIQKHAKITFILAIYPL